MATEKQIDHQLEKTVLHALQNVPDGTITIIKKNNHIAQIVIDEDRQLAVAESKRQHLRCVSS